MLHESDQQLLGGFRGDPAHITILGGGTAGLAVGYYARKNGLPFTIYEANRRLGGNCVTFRHGDFAFDSGAHRLHDQDPEITKELKQLLKDDLQEIHLGSCIYYRKRMIDFPLSPLNLALSLGPYTALIAAAEIIYARSKRKNNDESFEAFVLNKYGKTIARRFLLNYSEKLWGVPCRDLSVNVSGKRMKGLCVTALIKELFLGKRAKTVHMDGSFFYPKMGIGAFTDAVAIYCKNENIRPASKITAIGHDGTRINSIKVNAHERVVVDELVSSLPIRELLEIMMPAPPDEILDLARRLRYRQVILVTLSLNKESVTNAATVYFPSPEYPFTRLYEPRNRSREMSPPGKTSLAVEIPCGESDAVWSMDDDQLSEIVIPCLEGLGWVDRSEIMDIWVNRLGSAYPVVDIRSEIFSYDYEVPEKI